MKYETPDLTTLTAAIDAIQAVKGPPNVSDSHREPIAGYEDWED